MTTSGTDAKARIPANWSPPTTPSGLQSSSSERGSSRAFGFFDVYVDGALAAHDGLETDDGARHAFAAELGPGEKRVEVYFPWSRRTFVSNFAQSLQREIFRPGGASPC